MAYSAIFLTIIIPIAIASGFTIQTVQPQNTRFSGAPAAIDADYRHQPIAGYPKVPPPNAYESGGREDDLLPPFQNGVFKRSIQDARVDPKTGYPLVAEPSWKYAGGNEEHLQPPLKDSVNGGGEQEAVDPKTGYPLLAQPHWKDAGGHGGIIALPLEGTDENFGQKEEAVDPKTGYPLKADPSWKDAGGDGKILELPLEESGSRVQKAVDPKTGYPLVAEEGWKDAGGDGEILELPLEEPKEAVDPKTGYPLQAQPGWKDAGGNGDILELPLEEPKEAVDPKTGYPLQAQPGWKDAGGDGDILELPLEETEQTAVDPKTGYPLIAQPGWKDAGGNGDILQTPLETSAKQPSVDPKTGYPLEAQPEWKDAGGNGDILELPLEQPNANAESRLGDSELSAKPPSEAVDPKTGYPLVAQPQWKDAGGNGDILELPLEQPNTHEGVQGRSAGSEAPVKPPTEAVHRNPLVTQPQWRHAGGDDDILQQLLQHSNANSGSAGDRYLVYEIYKLTELQPPLLEKNSPTIFSNSFSAPGTRKQSFSEVLPVQTQKRNSPGSQMPFDFHDLRPIESSYTYVGPENVFVTVTRYRQQNLNQHPNSQNRHFRSSTTGTQGFGVSPASGHSIFPQTGNENFNGRH